MAKVDRNERILNDRTERFERIEQDLVELKRVIVGQKP